MAERQLDAHQCLAVPADQALIGVISDENGHDVVRCFADEAAADSATADTATEQALALIGA